MQLTALLALIAAAATPSLSSPVPPTQAPITENYPFRIPTVHESAVLARRILRLTPIATLSTNLPSDAAHSHDYPIGLPDYIADCDPDQKSYPGAPTVLAMSIATSFRNVAAGSQISISLRWEPPVSSGSEGPSAMYSPAALPRFSLMTKLEDIAPSTAVGSPELAKCFTGYHPDAAWWLPGNRIHTSRWARLVVDGVYWVGGFGDRAYIGWIPKEEWDSVTEEEIEAARLPGEM